MTHERIGVLAALGRRLPNSRSRAMVTGLDKAYLPRTIPPWKRGAQPAASCDQDVKTECDRFVDLDRPELIGDPVG
jgi:hypothetical protein